MQVSAIGLSWYQREDYPRILEIMADAHKLPRTYDEFVKAGERAERECQAKGAIVVRAVIKPDEFVAWCAGHRLKVDAEARMRFANEAALAEVKQRHAGG